MRIYRYESGERKQIIWKDLTGPEEIARHVNEKTSEVHAATRWPEWWALRSSRRLAMEPWAQDLAAAFTLRRLLERDGTYEVENVSPTMPLLLTGEERLRAGLEKSPVVPPSRPVLGFLRWAVKRLRNRLLLRHLPKPWKAMDRCDLLIHTVILPDCVTPEGKLNDFFFPDVQKCAESHGRRVLTVGFAPALPATTAGAWSRTGHWAVFDEMIGGPELFRAWGTMRRMRRWIGEWSEPIAGLPVEWLRARWNDDIQQSEFFDSITAAGWAGAFCRSREAGFYVYSFERKTFEQAMLKAVQHESPATITCGYQNAAVTTKHYHFWSYGSDEDVIPHRILTVGAVTTELLTGPGKYPKDRIRIGGSLRQRSLLQREYLRRPIQNLLVLWAEGREQYEKFWSFLKTAWDGTDLGKYHFRIRPHPAIPFDFPDGDQYAGRYEIDPLDDVRQSIDWADVVLYASTSLAIIAAGSGIPVIGIRLPGYFDDDCVPEGQRMLHWRVGQPEDLKRVLSEIEELYDEDFDELLRRSQNFARNYFHPTTAEKFLRHLEANGEATK